MSKKILVVDDEEVIRKILGKWLIKSGYKVREASDGNQAIEALENECFDLLILDILMPRKDGWQVLREVKSNPKTKGIAVILLTAKNDDADMFKGYELGASYFITKPFTKAQLFYGLQRMLAKDSESANYTTISW